MRRENDMCGRRRMRRGEDGQAMVEFALILFPLLLLVAGIIQFGIGLNFWLDMNRIANQGARFAVVNCGKGTGTNCDWLQGEGYSTLQDWLSNQEISQGNNPTVTICYEDMNGVSGGSAVPTVGDPVTVRLKQPFNLVPMLDIDVDLKATATMRLEQVPSKAGLTVPPLGLCPSPW